MLKRILVLLAVFCMVGTAQAEMWKMGHIRPVNTPEDKACKSLAKRINELTKGDIDVRIFPASALGDWSVVQQRISMGAIEMALQPQDTQVDKRLSIMFFPYLFNNLEQVRKNMREDAPFRQEMEKLFLEQNIYPLAFWPSFFGGIGLKELPDNWDQPGANKAMKIRVPSDPAFSMNAQKMGYMVTPIPFSEAFTAMQTGIVDGVIGTGAVGYYSNFRDLIKYYLPINDHLEIYMVMVNLDLWNGLDETTRTEIQQAAREMEQERYVSFAKDEAEYMKKLADYGVKIVDIKPEVIDRFAKLASETCWPALAKMINEPYINRVLKLVEK